MKKLIELLVFQLKYAFLKREVTIKATSLNDPDPYGFLTAKYTARSTAGALLQFRQDHCDFKIISVRSDILDRCCKR